jgi:hypothetical protein
MKEAFTKQKSKQFNNNSYVTQQQDVGFTPVFKYQ